MKRHQESENVSPLFQAEELQAILEDNLDSEEQNMGDERQEAEGQFKKHRWIISYYNRTQIKFDFLTCCLVLFDCIITPVKNAYEEHLLQGDNPYIYSIRVVDYLVKMIFALDILLSFRRAYLNERSGKEIRDPKLIAIRYLKFYFWVDLLSAIPFDMMANSGILSLASLLKVFRLLRLHKIISFVGFDTDTRAKIRIVQLILTLVIIIHWITCYFYYIVEKSYLESRADLSGKFDFSYWMPQVDLNDETTEFYSESQTV